MIARSIDNEQNEDWWDNLPEAIKLSVEQAIKEIDEGKGISHEEVKEMYPQWFIR